MKREDSFRSSLVARSSQVKQKEQALIRECKEELEVILSVGDVFTDVMHKYPDITVHLTPFNATMCEGKLQKLEHNDIQWITPSEIPNYEFCPADLEILKVLLGDIETNESKTEKNCGAY